MLFPLITFPYVARVLMPEGIGLVNFYNAIISYITLFCSLGIPLYALREIARVKNDKDKLATTTSEILLLNIIFALLGYVLVVILTFTVPQIKNHKLLFLLMSSNILFVTIGCEWFYQGIEDFKYITIRSLIIKTICVILLFILVRSKSDILYYGLYLTIGVVGGNVINFFRLRKYINFNQFPLNRLSPLRHVKGVSKIFILTIIGSIYLQLNTVLLGFLSDNASVGYFSGAYKLARLILGIVTSLGIVLLPRLTSLSDSNNKNFKNILTKSNDFVVMISLPLTCGLYLLSEPLILLFCGDEYIEAIKPLRVLSPIIFFIGLSYIAAQANYAIGKENLTIKIGLIGAIVDMILNVLLIPQFAAYGAAIATAITECTILLIYILLYIMTSKKLPFHSIHFCKCIMACILIVTITIILQGIIKSFVVQVIMIPSICIAIYFLALWLMRDSYITSIITSIRNKII